MGCFTTDGASLAVGGVCACVCMLSGVCVCVVCTYVPRIYVAVFHSL